MRNFLGSYSPVGASWDSNPCKPIPRATLLLKATGTKGTLPGIAWSNMGTIMANPLGGGRPIDDWAAGPGQNHSRHSRDGYPRGQPGWPSNEDSQDGRPIKGSRARPKPDQGQPGMPPCERAARAAAQLGQPWKPPREGRPGPARTQSGPSRDGHPIEGSRVAL